MVKHCTLCEELYWGKVKLKSVFVGRVFGRFALKILLSGNKALERNMPSSPVLIVSEEFWDLDL